MVLKFIMERTWIGLPLSGKIIETEYLNIRDLPKPRQYSRIICETTKCYTHYLIVCSNSHVRCKCVTGEVVIDGITSEVQLLKEINE